MLKLMPLILLVSIWTTAAFGECVISGHVDWQENTMYPELPAWMYTVTVTWNTDTPYGLSHFDVFIDEFNVGCTCEEVEWSLEWNDPVGHSTGEPGGCTVDYYAMVSCNGDPSIDQDGIMIKFEPYEDECEPGPTGEGTFVIFSPYEPWPIPENDLFLIDKYGLLVCTGSLTGRFPGLPCDPVQGEFNSWGTVKVRYSD